ncbi:carbamoyltransferase HypF [Ruminiclostridium hungatei]|uniref:Carbamoyltransferase n=1 Tax=Ruminiclostridium hungatei TaxID=48256 RepID=A0A1V4SSK9_RUMHU|nr:carbamoyltransferase HypF [Ruminiclostridium hungatei]OPX46227.1 carbamoyltransferase HypF [Ruminiclostridium hungatei]
MNRYRILITGIVQGVGFRPFIFNLAKSMGLKGWVGNSDSSVVIEIDAGEPEFSRFIETIKTSSPVLSRIEAVCYEVLPALGFQDFVIEQSRAVSKGQIFISPDVCTCGDCVNELKDPHNRRYDYPFINCTNCGPRFTIIRDIPYDRDKTTMDRFLMCRFCSAEYKNPGDRRYHAQPVSCTACGPVLNILDESGKELLSQVDAGSGACLEYLAETVKSGKIAAIKGIGGYHLACDALREGAVKRLRSRKHRDDKPFALMMKDISVVEKYCHICDKERELLKSPAAPIVLLRKREGAVLPAEVAQLNRHLGVMLPYTPIHHILFEKEGFPEVLVMTSGNLSSEPIFYRDEEAVAGLAGIADAFLTNDRDIYIRTDDSVTRVFRDKEYIIRRSRGYVPMPVKLEVHKMLGVNPGIEIPSVLACGGELKNVFCINKGNMFYLSQHIGDLENESTNRSFVHAVEHFKKLLDIDPGHIAFDLHPGYFSSQYGLQHKIQNKTGVQHHKAHIAAGMAENGLSGEVIGVSFDGTGYGEDGCIWGGEFFTGGYFGMERAGSLQYVMMPGSDSAVRHPWKMALGHLYSAGLQSKALGQDSPSLLKGIRPEDIAFTIRMLERKLNCPETSSMGRLFDAVSAILGIKTDISYEGQAAVELEYYASDMAAKPYEVVLETGPAGSFTVRTDAIITQLVQELEAGKSLESVASSFHATVARIVLKGCLEIRNIRKLNRVVLSGGVFQNLTLLAMSTELLENGGFEVHMHSQVPANDGGIALGQAIMAIACSTAKS